MAAGSLPICIKHHIHAYECSLISTALSLSLGLSLSLSLDPPSRRLSL
jgi:hypothetical protein